MTRKWFGLPIVAGMAAFSLLVLPELPAEIPIHWNLADEPVWASAFVFLAMVTIPVAYSYVLWRDVGAARVG